MACHPDPCGCAALQGLATLAPLRVIEEPAPPSPALRIETLGPLLLTGIGASYLAEDTAGIPSQWQRLYAEQPQAKAKPQAYGVFHASNGEGELDYLAGYEVEHAGQAPHGFQRLRLARQHYALVRHEGHIGSVTWRRAPLPAQSCSTWME